MSILRLGINIDHVATIRNARGGVHPCPVHAAQLAAHLREDRRHIRDRDIDRLKAEIALSLNLEMAMTPEMLAIALRVKPHAVCLVPEKREELTTEGGLDVLRLEKELKPFVQTLQDNGSRVSLFIDPVTPQIDAAQRIGARAIELHTGAYAEQAAQNKDYASLIQPLFQAAHHAHALGLEVHAGHGLNYDNVGAIAAIAPVVELNIGHFLIGESIFIGLTEAIHRMRFIMDNARRT
jgi:pyridoxine 5-phosphate synthase